MSGVARWAEGSGSSSPSSFLVGIGMKMIWSVGGGGSC